ncbi:MAG TPA: GNAT family N-acetyltransferase [Woeseiaceae bacterium]|nr:GNAT family N-acetyltransferase [Woeseiaceae bacterium]
MTVADNNNSSDYVIRQATAEDVPAIFKLLRELAESGNLAHRFSCNEDDLRRHGFGEQPMFEALLAESHGTAIGLSLFFFTYSSWRGAKGVYVQDLVVSQGAQAQGLGRRLIVATARHAVKSGATHLRLSVECDNDKAIGFYRRLGLRHSDSERIFEASGATFEELLKDQ